MRTTSALFVLSVALACSKAAPSPRPTPASPAAAAPVASNVLRGKVVEKINAGQYTYLKLQSAEGEVWTAVPATSKNVGETAGVVGPIWMENFKSSSLNRTWERIAFGTLEGETPAAAEAPAAQPVKPAGMFAGAAATMPGGHPAAAPVDTTPIKVAPASGPQGKTVADIYASKLQLKDKPVSVHGKVVKATNGVLGKNWLHVRDGTGKAGSDDLTVASDDTATVGQTVTVKGVVHLDRDLGAGYRYEVLVEDAQIKPE